MLALPPWGTRSIPVGNQMIIAFAYTMINRLLLVYGGCIYLGWQGGAGIIAAGL